LNPHRLIGILILTFFLLTVTQPAAGQSGPGGHAGHSAPASPPAGKPTTPPPGKPDDLDMSGLTMESLKQEGKMVEVSPGTVQISPERQQMIGVRTGTVERRPMAKVIRANGRVDYDEKRLATISPKIGGWIEELYVDFTGAPVKKGAPLLTLYSPELVSTQEEYVAALAARRQLAASPYPEVARSGDTLVDSARRRLKLWDISEAQIRALEETREVSRTMTLYSPYAGVVLEKTAFRGMRVEPGMALYRLADLSVVWVIADVYEYELPFIRLGQSATVEFTNLPSERFTGKATYVYPSLDPRTRTARVRLEIPNRGGKLKPEMYAEVVVQIDLGTRLAVPESAVIDTGIRQIAILDRGQGYFQPREIKIGARVNGFVEVLAGLAPGDRVVTSANFLIDSESKLKEAVGEMSGGGHAGHSSHGQ
jgi:Cu(I)/Ag(I) efflux system membrane fusion protein